MKVSVGYSAASALTPSSIGPQIEVWQKAGVANTRTNGSFAARASATERA